MRHVGRRTRTRRRWWRRLNVTHIGGIIDSISQTCEAHVCTPAKHNNQGANTHRAMRTRRYRLEQVRLLHLSQYLCHAKAQLGPDDVREGAFQELDPMPLNLHNAVRSVVANYKT